MKHGPLDVLKVKDNAISLFYKRAVAKTVIQNLKTWHASHKRPQHLLTLRNYEHFGETASHSLPQPSISVAKVDDKLVRKKKNDISFQSNPNTWRQLFRWKRFHTRYWTKTILPKNFSASETKNKRQWPLYARLKVSSEENLKPKFSSSFQFQNPHFTPLI